MTGVQTCALPILFLYMFISTRVIARYFEEVIMAKCMDPCMSPDFTRREQTFERHLSSVRRPGEISPSGQTKLIAYVDAKTPGAVMIHSSLLSAFLQRKRLSGHDSKYRHARRRWTRLSPTVGLDTQHPCNQFETCRPTDGFLGTHAC